MSTIAINKSQEISKEEIWLKQFNFEREWELGNQNKVRMKMKKDALKNREDRKST